ncbi:DUF3786 domain-containing protein [Desulfatitalea alkaliphila]|uniref:DUF3786 domain-containing protein n=1 Tax=Desulfatitalea alkaliphila TaxID=2929485 RepID=A0AA41UM80_9BACT|nr:DUF3786 domain-containing protein [Desulfatitalea alkaliphila]MCJ8502351.1 DUF3786 domain-containing protein [Desulfatitalea alkaliphila]
MKSVATRAAAPCEPLVRFFDRHYRRHGDRWLDQDGCAPTEMVDLLLRRLPAAAPEEEIDRGDWCSFRELPGAGPLAVNFANNTHKTIAQHFGADLPALDRAVAALDGQPESDPGYDRRYRFQALPDVCLVLLYNSPDDLFTAQANLLFQRSSQHRHPIRDLFILGTYLTGRLVGQTKTGGDCDALSGGDGPPP